MTARGVVALVLLFTALSSTVVAQDPADDAWKRGELAVARQLYTERLAADSTDVLALHRLGLMLAWDGQHLASIRLFDKLLQVAPEHEDARLDRARVLAWAGRFDESIDAYGDILDSAPGHRRALLGTAQTLSWINDLDFSLQSPAGTAVPPISRRVEAWPAPWPGRASSEKPNSCGKARQPWPPTIPRR